MHLILLSGPKTTEQQARTALADAGFTVRAETHNHGLPDRKTDTGKRGRQAASFIGVERDDGDPTAVRDAVTGLGYELRLHRELGPPPEPSADDVIADLRARVEKLEAR